MRQYPSWCKARNLARSGFGQMVEIHPSFHPLYIIKTQQVKIKMKYNRRHLQCYSRCFSLKDSK